MQCFALTSDRCRCTQTATNGSVYCAAHLAEWTTLSDAIASGASRKVSSSKSWNAVFARVRGALAQDAPPSDGGKYDVPGWLNDAPTPEVIRELLTNPDSMVRWMAAFVLRKRRTGEALEPLWQTRQNDPVRFVRQQAAVALGKIGIPRVFAPLVEGLNHDADPGVREACAIALGNLGNPAAAQEIARVLEREENVFVKWDCIVALGQLGDDRVEKLLVRLQAEELAQVVRDACRDALAEIQRRARTYPSPS